MYTCVLFHLDLQLSNISSSHAGGPVGYTRTIFHTDSVGDAKDLHEPGTSNGRLGDGNSNMVNISWVHTVLLNLKIRSKT